MDKKRIVIITDCKDIAFNEIRATLIKNIKNHDNVSIEPLVSAKEFSVINGAFIVRLMAEIYDPKNTIFLVILNSLKTNRKDRARIYGETKNGFKFVGANTGTLNWLLKDFGIKRLYELNKEKLTGKDFVSFGGKYIHAPLAARIANDEDVNSIGKEVNQDFLCDFKIKKGQIVHIDNFGVIKINEINEKLNEGDKINVFINGEQKIEATYTNSMKDLSDGSWTLFPGSSLNGLLELAKVRKLDSAKELNVKIGDIVTWERI